MLHENTLHVIRIEKQSTVLSDFVQEHEDLLRRLRGWMEHYKLPSRMAPFKRDAFAISCPTETRPRAGNHGIGFILSVFGYIFSCCCIVLDPT